MAEARSTAAAAQAGAPTHPVVLVTGATGPVGRAVAARLSSDGAHLALFGRDRDRLAALGAALGLEDGAWLPIVGSLSNGDSARAVAAAVVERFGRIDVLVHLVGGWVGGTAVADLDHDEVRDMLDRHLWTTLHITQAVVPGMVERGFGRMIAVSSPLVATPTGRGASYAMAKAAEEVLVRSLARETAHTGVTANLLLVGSIDVNGERDTAPTAANATWTTPEEAADAIAFLASSGAANITGARIPLGGRG